MTTDSSLQKRQQKEQNQDLRLETGYTSKTKPQENGISNGEQDTESSGLSPYHHQDGRNEAFYFSSAQH